MAIRPKYLVEALTNPNTSLDEKARALHRYHARSIPFEVRLRPIDSTYNYGPNFKKLPKKERRIAEKGHSIHWAVNDGLSVLLHELGHHACKHRRDSCCDSARLEEEAEAWIWAEKWAYRHGIKFDYKAANKAFENYQAGRPVMVMNWRYGEEDPTDP